MQGYVRLSGFSGSYENTTTHPGYFSVQSAKLTQFHFVFDCCFSFFFFFFTGWHAPGHVSVSQPADAPSQLALTL